MFKHIRRAPLYVAVYIVAVLLIACLLALGSALARCELLTRQYHDTFALAYKSNSMITDVADFKVLSCDGRTAEVYYISDTQGDVLVFENRNGAWVEAEWRTVWSKSGSASDVVWPYVWHVFKTGA